MKKKLLLFSLLLSSIIGFSQIPSNGLLAYYPFCKNSNDVSGNGHHLLNSNASLAQDRFGVDSAAYEFNGLNSILYNDTVFNFATEYSISFWMEAYAAQDALLVYNGDGNINGVGYIYSNGIPNGFGNGSRITVLAGGLSVYLGQQSSLFTWYQVALVKRKNKSYTYINGVCVDSFIVNINPTVGKFHIGLDYTNGTNPFNGKVDDVAIYNRALSDIEIQQLFSICKERVIENEGVTKSEFNEGIPNTVACCQNKTTPPPTTSVTHATSEYDVVIFPNPSNGYFIVTSSNNNVKRILVTNLLGQKIIDINNDKEFYLKTSGQYIITVFGIKDQVIKRQKLTVY